MTIRTFPNGLGESLGSSLVVNAPFYITERVWYVHATTGTDGSAPSGESRNKPLATLAQAITNASDGDVIVLMDGHTETLSAAQTVSKRVTIAGGGRSNGKPTVKLTSSAAAASILTVSGANVRLVNIWFEENTQANSGSRIAVSGANFRMIDCYMELNGNDDATGLALNSGATGARIQNSTFVSTATATNAQPIAAIYNGAAISDLELMGVIVDDGTYGFSSTSIALDTAAVTRFFIEDLTLLNGADVRMHSGSTGYIGGIEADESAFIDWDPGE